ncbi:hypothetical protein BJ875DRAFT_545925 [Amylocarpus encephaloides]|uniref:Uncharacterized protein n=1 Tax=Amylocarpus encephaloides TaxID=45428 RepID=A0A9P8C1W5_9HELO|nr:hypothetical protein BJ875DRAFT_545925 [Amylocarpus encephaloides]
MPFGRFSSSFSLDTSTLNNFDNDHTPLESWLRNYDSGNPGAASAGTVSSSLALAFSRPTYTPSSFYTWPSSGLTKYGGDGSLTSCNYHISSSPEISSSLLDHESRERSLADSYTPPTYPPTDLIQTPSQTIGNYNVPTLNLPPIGTPRELERLPPLRPFSPTPIQPSQLPTPIDRRFWLVTASATTQQLDNAISRLVSELNWDFFASNFHTLNPTGGVMTEQEWRKNIILGYEAYITLKAQGNEGTFSQNFQDGLDGYRTFVHNIISFFSDVANNTKIECLHSPTSEKDNLILRIFWECLQTGGDIQTFPATRCANAGLSYPGHGKSKFDERLRLAQTANRYGRSIYSV